MVARRIQVYVKPLKTVKREILPLDIPTVLCYNVKGDIKKFGTQKKHILLSFVRHCQVLFGCSEVFPIP